VQKPIKIGNISVLIPEGTTDVSLERTIESTACHETPNMVESSEEIPTVYSTVTPLQYQIAAVNAETNIGHVKKPWVRKTYFLLFIIFPFFTLLCFWLRFLFFSGGESEWGLLIFFTLIFVPTIGFYLYQWDKNNGF
jgi:hypothetical protein